MKYKCKYCSYETDSPQGIAGHIGAHIRKGDVSSRKMSPVPQMITTKGITTVSEVADALLRRIVSALSEHDNLLKEIGELKGYKDKCLELEKQLQSAVEEKERILKIHNDQIKRREFTDAETLKRLARL